MKEDLKRSLDGYQARRGQVRVLEVPPQTYLMVDGHGDPDRTPAWTEALRLLYPVAYALKATSRAAGRDYVVPPLEGLWWAQDMAAFTTRRDASSWDWTAMLLVPAWLTPADVTTARRAVAERRGLPLEGVRAEALDEGLCVQTLHVGSFEDEAPVLHDLHTRFLPEHGLRLRGKHHEVYLSDPRRTAPARLRTILRQPVARA